jgi:hypothetical protein
MTLHQRPPVIVAGGVAPDLTYRRPGFFFHIRSLYSARQREGRMFLIDVMEDNIALLAITALLALALCFWIWRRV